jgi:hypothetical protein
MRQHRVVAFVGALLLAGVATGTAAREPRFSGELRFGLFYDSNVAVVPSASSDLVAQVLRQDQAKRDSPGELGALNLAYTWLKALDWEGSVAYCFLQTYNNQLPAFNVQNHTPTVGIAYRSRLLDVSYFAGLQMTYGFITLSGDKFVQRGIVNPYFSLFENPANLTTVEYIVPRSEGVYDSSLTPEGLWDRSYTNAPRPRLRSEKKYRTGKHRWPSEPSATTSTSRRC